MEHVLLVQMQAIETAEAFVLLIYDRFGKDGGIGLLTHCGNEQYRAARLFLLGGGLWKWQVSAAMETK